jgi:hypothetical protein
VVVDVSDDHLELVFFHQFGAAGLHICQLFESLRLARIFTVRLVYSPHRVNFLEKVRVFEKFLLVLGNVKVKGGLKLGGPNLSILLVALLMLGIHH